ncbi:MAG: cadmium-translocating P-type ATPase [Bacteroidetes bacterium]|nr:MAG: cadmium-translocating P-type ATPase [Bacteroidota bacterium]REK08065.1 MAG: cadmium-translocating P-type ATPase [Bacteroidota bacterium]REK32270.1 MAG: cadmium-translocating P-type ATPase [Bacteroidota bacterium]
MNEVKRIEFRVEGMDCANCAQTISKTLTKKGLEEVNVDFLTGEVSFERISSEDIDEAVIQIHKLGYKVVSRSDKEEKPITLSDSGQVSHLPLTRTSIAFFISLVFTVPLLLHMFSGIELLHHPIFQLGMCLPVMAIGILFFGRSALKSIRAGSPNMDVLISVGSWAAFLYSLAGTYQYYGTAEVHNYMFYETAATIITLVLLGNLIEQRSVRQTTTAIHELGKLQVKKAKRVFEESGEFRMTEIDASDIEKGDLLQVNTGDQIPADGVITEGEGIVNEAILTGESNPVSKHPGDKVSGSTINESGNFRMIAEHVGEETALGQIIRMVKDTQKEKPAIQKLGDRVSSVFVPAVVLISAITFLINFYLIDLSASRSLMNSIAVLVISCPCAMGLATPTAVMVGLGRAARNGILIKGGQTLETLSNIRTVVFDKTGTLTKGEFIIKKIDVLEGNQDEIKTILFAIERNSSHPIAKSITRELKAFEHSASAMKWKTIHEDKGTGINVTDENGNLFSAGSFNMVRHFHTDNSHSIYLLKNNKLIATVDLEDEIKSNTSEVIKSLKRKGMRVIMLSGDRESICRKVAGELGIEEVYSEQLPAQKLELIRKFSSEQPTAMVGDGINDAPALSLANIGISISNATNIAVQSAQVILLHQKNLDILLSAFSIGNRTYTTIKQNLFWAFFYNVLAIPIAAAGYLSPMIAALSMAFSDIVVIGNSIRLKYIKIDS